ncbi:saccharopine dehydrogenase [Halostella sp. JP-L12]|uniref:saccharopine dehydrogenase family protein n=1 Tax=Halostella TaxID=1843185 RepID=UPI000EF83FFD|nr:MULTISPECIES: saccharopine dehydrogenase NADP-binding domain-containing protein [Halostella]NHN48238.1 saccharopine dehydrogenase [Halostella sp. JP-L12]
MVGDLLIYGSYGYAGRLIARRAVDSGLDPTIAGRDPELVERQATDLGVDHRAFSLKHQRVVENRVAEADAVLNCAGPFSSTTGRLASACMAVGTDYLDLAGEIDVLEWVAARDREAEKADVSLVPGVGFDVAATDCLAGFLESQLRSATDLTLALDGLGTFSPGTLKSIVDDLPKAGAVRENGAVRTRPAAWKTREFDFGRGSKTAVTVPWGDVSSAYYTTGIPNIEVYATVPEYAIGPMRRSRSLMPLLGSGPVKTALKALIDATVSGPSAEKRSRSSTRVWGEVTDDEGNSVAARLETPDTYDFATASAVDAATRVLEDDAPAGFQTPASAFGADFALDIAGVGRTVVDAKRAPAAGTGR